MQVTHPRADDDRALPSVATVNGTDYRLEDGVVEAPAADAQALADAWARRFDVPPDGLLGPDVDDENDDDPATLRVDEDDEGGGGDETVADPPLDPAEYSVADLRDALDDAGLDADDLEDIRELEKWGKNRTTALDAIDARLEA